MAAEALILVLLKKLATGAINQAERVLGVRSDLQKLESALSAIQAVLHAAEERSVTDTEVRDWVAKLKEAAYDVDDLLDDFQTDAQRRNQNTSMSKKVHIFFSRSNPLAFRIKMSFKIKAIVEKLDMIAQERTRYHLRVDPLSHTPQHDQMDTRTTAAVVNEANVYGRDDDVEKVLKLMLEEETDQEDLSIVTIVGMGGLGKTTLAQLVYKHHRLVKQGSFDSRIWVYVSDKFAIKRIATAIIEFETGEKCELSELAPIVNRLQQILAGKKFLLVLDDVWIENEQEWEKLKDFLAVGAKGSKILVTTRLVKVATMMGTVSPYYLGVLSQDACWRLFEERAFRGEGMQRDPCLEAIGREIVAKCGGSPLAAKALGSLMRFKTGRREWLAVRDSDTWRSTDEGNQVMASLRLSYDHLSPRLKQCFAYCCIFPKGTSINGDNLVLHWIALGFIPSSTSLESVDKGKEYFNNIVCISFLDEDSDGYGPGFYKMHDLVHDLATSVAGDEHFICYADQIATIPRRCRFCTLVGTLEESELKDLFRECGKIRALRLQKSNISSFIMLTSLPHLRVLDTGRSLIKEVHVSIKRLQHLRYFKLIGNVKSLPQSFTSLRNLQTLDLSHCNSLGSLPESLDRLESLQILNLAYCTILVSLPESIVKLAKLRTLQLPYCEALHSLPQSLSNLSNLEELDLQGCMGIAKFPESIGKLANLRTLQLSDCEALYSLPQSIGNLSNLENLDLWECKGIAELPESIGKLANLRTLRLSYCSALQTLPQSLSNLSNLEELDLRECKGIGELPESIGKLANLRTLQLSDCDGLHLLPHSLGNLSNLENLDLWGCKDIAKLPESIGKLANLRVLVLSRCEALHSLPQSLSNLSNLEELDLWQCSRIAELQEEMGNMTCLRHLKNEWMSSLRGMPLGIGKMRSLITLQLFVVGEGINHSSIAEMQHLNLIAGKLMLSHLENVKSPEDVARANMKEKHRLQRLCLRWSDLIPHDPYSIHEEVLAELIPHPNLKKLEIERYPGINFPNWVRMMGASVPNLVDLMLYGLKCLPPFLGGLPPCLKKLSIEGIDTGRHLELSGAGSVALLQLEELRLRDMPNLEEWFTVVAAVDLYPHLVKLSITNCPKMHAEPYIPASVKELFVD